MSDDTTWARESAEAGPKARLLSFEVQNYRLFKKERLEVHPDVTVLVGRNDVGKSTLLKALELYGLAREGSVRGLLERPDITGTRVNATCLIAEWKVEDRVWKHSLILDVDAPRERLECDGSEWTWNPSKKHLKASKGDFELTDIDRHTSLAGVGPKRWKLDADAPREVYEPILVTTAFRVPRAYLFEPSALMKTASLSLEAPRSNGAGWVTWLQEITSRRNGDIERLEAAVRRLFPHFESVKVVKESRPEPGSSRRIVQRRAVITLASPGAVEVKNAFRVPASRVSSGLLLALAHMAFFYAADQGDLLLLEEPENGLNPKITFDMIKVFLDVVRERNQQLIFTTHNEWWLDLVPPESIRVLTRDAEGAHVHTPAKDAIRKLLEDSELYPSEIMSTYGPEGFLFARPPAP